MGEERPREDRMDKPVLLVLILIVSFMFGRLVREHKEIKKAKEKTRQVEEEAIAWAIFKHVGNDAPQVYRSLKIVSDTCKDSQIYIRSCDDMNLEHVLLHIKEYQDFFDQVLAVYAWDLNQIHIYERAYKKGKKERRDYQSKSRAEIDTMLEKDRVHEEKMEQNKVEHEQKFWLLHKALKDRGIKTWDSYKDYLSLKPRKASEILA